MGFLPSIYKNNIYFTYKLKESKNVSAKTGFG